jgi:hypothetical protein
VTRAERYAQVVALRARGLTHAQIAGELGVSLSLVRNLLYDPDGSKQRARRERYRGTCETCGAKTDGSNGRAAAPTRCVRCENAHRASEEGRERWTFWTRERIIEAIRWWARTYGEPPASPDWNPYLARNILRDEERAARGERLIRERRVPWMKTVVERFGSWNDGILAAGFTPRAPFGTKENRRRHRSARKAAA